MKKAKTNALGKYIENNKDLNYTKVAQHLGTSRQNIWSMGHRDLLELRLNSLYKISRIENLDFADFMYKLLKMEE